MDMPKIDWAQLVADAQKAVDVAEASKGLLGLIPGVSTAEVEGAIKLARALLNALSTARTDADLAVQVLAATTESELDALQARLDALDADTERMLDET